jgi:Aspartic acid proteinase inhibitor
MRMPLIRTLSFLYFVVFALAPETRAQTPGGYRLVSNDDSESIAAAKFAVREEGQKLGKNIVFSSMVYAQRQVVSGTNYKLCLKVKVNGTSKRAETVVYRNLQKQYALTSWSWGQCTKPAELKTSVPATAPRP